MTLVREGAAQIVPIESVRNQVIARIGLPPHEAEVRVFIVEEATALRAARRERAAQDARGAAGAHAVRAVHDGARAAPADDPQPLPARAVRRRRGAADRCRSGARRARSPQLGEELARDRHDPTLPVRVAEGKGDAAPVLDRRGAGACTSARTPPRRAATSTTARRAAQRAQAILSWHTAVAIHNANPQLAIEAVIAQLRQLEPAGAIAVSTDESDDGPDDGPDDPPGAAEGRRGCAAVRRASASASSPPASR